MSDGGRTLSTTSHALLLASPWHPSRFYCKYFHPDATWTDVFSVQWGDGNNWLFLHVSDISRTIAHLRASRAVGTCIVPFAAWAPWLASLRQGRRWAAGVKGLVWHRGLACRHPCWTRCSCPKAWIHRTATPVLLAHSSLIQHTMGSRPARLSRALRLLAVQRR